MAKYPEKLTPLRQVRDAIGLSQNDFADLVGIKYDLYQSLELRRAGLTEANAYKIYIATGATPDSLDHRRSSRAMSVNEPGDPYSAQTWAGWKRSKPIIEDCMSDLLKDVIEWTQFLCDLATRHGKAWDLHIELAQVLSDCATNFELQNAIANELKQLKLTTKVTYTYGELRRNPALAAAVGYKDTNYRKGRVITNEDYWTATLVDPVRWEPSGPFPKVLAAKLSAKGLPTNRKRWTRF